MFEKLSSIMNMQYRDQTTCSLSMSFQIFNSKGYTSLDGSNSNNSMFYINVQTCMYGHKHDKRYQIKVVFDLLWFSTIIMGPTVPVLKGRTGQDTFGRRLSVFPSMIALSLTFLYIYADFPQAISRALPASL
jgi:hypothetical protein